ncbi:MAG: hypothetical protein ACR2JK_03525 [Geodermatophilaceae bacterium]
MVAATAGPATAARAADALAQHLHRPINRPSAATRQETTMIRRIVNRFATVAAVTAICVGGTAAIGTTVTHLSSPTTAGQTTSVDGDTLARPRPMEP